MQPATRRTPCASFLSPGLMASSCSASSAVLRYVALAHALWSLFSACAHEGYLFVPRSRR